MNECFCKATYVGDENWRRVLWTEVFGKPEVPIISPFPIARAQLPDGVSPVYLLDKSRVTHQQMAHLAAGIAMNFCLPFDEVFTEMQSSDIPIKATDVIATGCQRHVLGAIL